MLKARKRFVLYAMLSVFALLAALLGVINGVNFTMASTDADRVTAMLAEERRALPAAAQAQGRGMDVRGGRPAQFGPVGPDSPETLPSLRYFTFAFDEDGSAERLAWAVSAVSEEDALSWARSLARESGTGWTGWTYRYRVWQADGRTCVTVIDQGRELLSCYRILLISLVGLAAGMLISGLALVAIGRRLFQPLEEADRRQKRFLAEVEQEFKLPLTVINANTEILEREGGETAQTLSINRQVKRMISLVRDLGSLAVFADEEGSRQRFDLGALALAAGEAARPRFAERGVSLKLSAAPGVLIEGDSERMNDLLAELLENERKFARSWAELSVRQENGRVTVTAANDALLPDGPADQAFDRFVRLENAGDAPGVGLGLSHVKETVRAHNGRASARVAQGAFTLRVSL